MKPHPYLLHRAMSELATTADACVMIGDSETDVEVAHLVGSPAVAFANRPSKRRRFAPLRPDAIIESMFDIAAAAVPAPPSRLRTM